MAVTTPYDEEISVWRHTLKNAVDKQTINEAKRKLLALSVQRWNSVERLFDLSDEIEERYKDYKSDDDNKGIYDASYDAWRKELKKGVDENSFRAARNLLASYDQTVFTRMAQERLEYIDENIEIINGDDSDSDDTVVTDNTPSVKTAVRNSNGVYSLVGGSDVAAVKDNVVNSQPKSTAAVQDPAYLDRRPAWIDTNTEYHRTKTSEGVSVDSAYIKRYYSVIDAEIYFGNEYVEDVCDINWSIRQNVAPLFGYNSYTYDEVARGNRIIFGNFIINFTSPNYLFSILEEADKANVTLITNMTSYTVPKLSESIIPQVNGRTVGSRERGHNANMWPQTFDIDIIFGEKTGAGNPVHILILGCAIQSCQMALSASTASSPPAVMEQYSFIAQDIMTVVTGENDQKGSDVIKVTTDDLNGKKTNNDNLDTATKKKTDNTDKEEKKSDSDSDIAKKGSTDDDDKATKLRNQLNAEYREKLKDATGFVDTILSGGDTEGDVQVSYDKDIGKLVSNKRTCELLARFSALFSDNENMLTAAEQKELAVGIKAAEAKGEYFLVDSDTESLIAFRYVVEHNGELKACTSIIDSDGNIVNALSGGTYYTVKK